MQSGSVHVRIGVRSRGLGPGLPTPAHRSGAGRAASESEGGTQCVVLDAELPLVPGRLAVGSWPHWADPGSLRFVHVTWGRFQRRLRSREGGHGVSRASKRPAGRLRGLGRLPGRWASAQDPHPLATCPHISGSSQQVPRLRGPSWSSSVSLPRGEGAGGEGAVTCAQVASQPLQCLPFGTSDTRCPGQKCSRCQRHRSPQGGHLPRPPPAHSPVLMDTRRGRVMAFSNVHRSRRPGQ